ncbi:hypothetical protein G6F57_019825 [Rhizopus arrhizus]|nr:hypothetical protein G6F57_019825 [Rhizopus arrhizus]
MAAILVGGQDVETFQFNAALACLGMRQGVGTGGQVADHIAAIHQQPDRTARVGQLGALGDAAVVRLQEIMQFLRRIRVTPGLVVGGDGDGRQRFDIGQGGAADLQRHGGACIGTWRSNHMRTPATQRVSRAWSPA